MKPCLNCGKPVSHHRRNSKSYRAGIVFCSRKCAAEYHGRKYRKREYNRKYLQRKDVKIRRRARERFRYNNDSAYRLKKLEYERVRLSNGFFKKHPELVDEQLSERVKELLEKFKHCVEVSVASRIPARVDRLRALGNAVVPQVAEYVALCIIAREKEEQTLLA